MAVHKAPVFGEIAVRMGLVTTAQVRKALDHQSKANGRREKLGEILVRAGALSESDRDKVLLYRDRLRQNGQRKVLMACPSCKLRYAVLSMSERPRARCPKCSGELTPAKKQTRRPSEQPEQIYTRSYRHLQTAAAPASRTKEAECPVCSHRFTSEPDHDFRVVCPSCSTSFEVF